MEIQNNGTNDTILIWGTEQSGKSKFLQFLYKFIFQETVNSTSLIEIPPLKYLCSFLEWSNFEKLISTLNVVLIFLLVPVVDENTKELTEMETFLKVAYPCVNVIKVELKSSLEEFQQSILNNLQWHISFYYEDTFLEFEKDILAMELKEKAAKKISNLIKINSVKGQKIKLEDVKIYLKSNAITLFQKWIRDKFT